MPIIGTISDIGGQFEDFIRGVNESREALDAMQGQISSVSRTAQRNADALAQLINALVSGMEGMRTEVGNLSQTLGGLSSATARSRQAIQEEAATVADIYKIYQQVDAEIAKLVKDENALRQSIEGLNQVQKLNEELNRTQEGSAARLRAEYKLLSIMWENMTAAERASHQELAKLARDKFEQLKQLEGQVKKISTGELNQTKGLSDIFANVGINVENLSGALNTLEGDTKKMAQVQQLYNDLLVAQEGSYDNLSAKYRLIKILHNAMSTSEMADNEAVATSLREIYEQMNLIQQRTGKYQLQVGDYSKAMNGLRIATNQVVRELPVLANGVSMFAIAISNNIPIFADQVVEVTKVAKAQKALKEEYLAKAAAAELAGDMEAAAAAKTAAASVKVVTAGEALLAALTGWQTWLVVGLTVLPAFIRNIEKKKKAQEEEAKAQKEVADATKEAVTAMRTLDEVYLDIRSAIQGEVTELEVLKNILGNTNRSWEDRVNAGKRLKQIFDEELEGFSEEEIAMGNAAEKMQILTEEIYNQAKARASLNKITELTQKMIELEGQRDLYGNWQMGTKTIKEYAEELERANQEGRSIRIGAIEMEYVDKYRAIVREMGAYQHQINEITDQISPSGLAERLRAGGGAGPKGDKSIPDYYMQVLEATTELMEEGVEKELAVLEVGWLKEQKGLNQNLKALTDMREGANKEELEEINNQIDNVIKLMTLGEEKYRQERMRVVNAGLHQYEEVVEEEIDLDEEKRKSVERNLKQEQFERNQAYYREYELSQRTQSDKEKLNSQLVDSERQYWEDYLATLRDMEILLPHEYEKIMNELAKGQEKGRRRRNRFGGVVEAGMAMFSDWGRTDESTGQRVLKDEYKDFVSAVDNALKQSMSFMDEWMDKRLEMAEVAVEAAEKEMEAAKSALDYELEARNQGYANSVETARRELEIQKANHRKALEEKKKVEEEQRMIDVATQISSLVTATANIWSSMTKNTGLLGPILAATATALMWGSFTAAQVKASQVARSKQFGEGTVELLEGGSHASGHDIDMGVAKDGTRRRAEGGEFFAIINRRNSRKYRKIIPDVINSFNDGTFGEKYYNANAAMGEFALGLLAGGSPTDVSKLEKEVHAIREQGEVNRYTDSRGNVIVRYKNLTRKYKI